MINTCSKGRTAEYFTKIFWKCFTKYFRLNNFMQLFIYSSFDKGHSYLKYFVQCNQTTSYFCSNNAASKSMVLSCVIFLYEKLKNSSIQSFKECFFFVFCLFFFFVFFLSLSNNTLHVMLSTYICHWNTC